RNRLGVLALCPAKQEMVAGADYHHPIVGEHDAGIRRHCRSAVHLYPVLEDCEHRNPAQAGWSAARSPISRMNKGSSRNMSMSRSLRQGHSTCCHSARDSALADLLTYIIDPTTSVVTAIAATIHAI